jgi:hypothetical protein
MRTAQGKFFAKLFLKKAESQAFFKKAEGGN